MMYSQDPIDAAIDALNEYSIAIPICEGYQFNLSDMREAMQAAIAAYLDAMPSPLYHCESVREAEQRSTAELATLRARAERAEAELRVQDEANDILTRRVAELEAAIKRQAAAALAGMNATKAVSSWQIQEARRLKAECSPASVASQREANERLTNELQAAQSTIADLTGQAERLREALTKVRPWFTPETMIGAGMIKIVDAALGGEKSTAPAFTLPPETPPPE